MLETLILAHLIRDDEYSRKVLPFLVKEYFTTTPGQHLYDIINAFVTAYKAPPTPDAIRVALDQSQVNGTAYKEVTDLLTEVLGVARIDSSRRQWLIDQTEQFCKQRAVYLALMESISVIENPATAAGVPMLLRDALSVGFNTHIGHDYIADAGLRYDMCHQQQTRIPFDLDLMNTITGGGLVPKTLNVVVAGTNVGKSLFLCHTAAAAISQGRNVLYITLEMAEEYIGKRIDANLLDVTLDTLNDMSRHQYDQSFAALLKRCNLGQLIIKEYPTSGGNVGHFRVLLDELALKKQFVPDLLIIDYINICSSVRFKTIGQTNSYGYVKAIAEELRGLAVEYKLPCLTATQFNREGYDNSDPSLTNTSESFGLPQTADLQVALITNESLDQDGLLMVKQLKNRYEDVTKFRRFTIKVDRAKMRLSNDPNQQHLANPVDTDTEDYRYDAPDETEIPRSKINPRGNVGGWKASF